MYARLLEKLLGAELVPGMWVRLGCEYVQGGRAHVTLPALPGYYMRARLVAMLQARGPLRPGYDVHHVDGNRMNDQPSNLGVLTGSDHWAAEYGERLCRRPGSSFGGRICWGKRPVSVGGAVIRAAVGREQLPKGLVVYVVGVEDWRRVTVEDCYVGNRGVVGAWSRLRRRHGEEAMRQSVKDSVERYPWVHGPEFVRCCLAGEEPWRGVTEKAA